MIQHNSPAFIIHNKRTKAYDESTDLAISPITNFFYNKSSSSISSYTASNNTPCTQALSIKTSFSFNENSYSINPHLALGLS